MNQNVKEKYSPPPSYSLKIVKTSKESEKRKFEKEELEVFINDPGPSALFDKKIDDIILL